MSRLTYQLNKIISLEEAKRKAAMWQMKGDKVVFTNGCFDILHRGHVTYLAQAAAEGSRLVIGLNTDASVKRLGKDENRPINSEESRALVLAALQVVDMIVFFDQDTPYELIKALQPDVLAKGADYDPDETDPSSKKYIVGSDIMKLKGGKIIAIPFVDGYSTTALIQKVVGSKS
jgi:D-glycero-beta-D-manno-heptose 1-phosphate adenylyltransferase